MKLQLPINPNRWDQVISNGYIFEFQDMDRVIPVRIGDSAMTSWVHLRQKMQEMWIDAIPDVKDIDGKTVYIIEAPEMVVNMTAVNNNLIE